MNGICIRCKTQMKWIGRIWLKCEHCGQLQVWPVSGENYGIEVEETK